MRCGRLDCRFVCTAIVAVAIFMLCSNVRAVLYLYDGFDYPAGELVGQNGGTGFSGVWAGNTGRTSVVAGGLSYTDTAGNQLTTAGNHIVTSGVNGSSNQTRDLPIINSGTTWWSFIGERLSVHATDAENVARAVGFQIFNTTLTPNERLSVGKGTTNVGSPTYNWSMLHSGAVANAVQTTKPILDQSFLLVRIDHLGDTTVPDNAYLWVNPLLNTEPTLESADAQYIGALDFSYNRVRAFAGNTTADGPYANFSVDEVRFGSTFADVTPHTPGGGLMGDFNTDGKVDAADYVVWRENPGGIYTPTDFDKWKTNFGGGAGTGAGVELAAVPEPATLALVAMLAAACVIRRRSNNTGGV